MPGFLYGPPFLSVTLCERMLFMFRDFVDVNGDALAAGLGH